MFLLDYEFSGYGLPAVYDLSYFLNVYVWEGMCGAYTLSAPSSATLIDSLKVLCVMTDTSSALLKHEVHTEF